MRPRRSKTRWTSARSCASSASSSTASAATVSGGSGGCGYRERGERGVWDRGRRRRIPALFGVGGCSGGATGSVPCRCKGTSFLRPPRPPPRPARSDRHDCGRVPAAVRAHGGWQRHWGERGRRPTHGTTPRTARSEGHPLCCCMPRRAARAGRTPPILTRPPNRHCAAQVVDRTILVLQNLVLWVFLAVLLCESRRLRHHMLFAVFSSLRGCCDHASTMLFPMSRPRVCVLACRACLLPPPRRPTRAAPRPCVSVL